jgi:hypothetical protein
MKGPLLAAGVRSGAIPGDVFLDGRLWSSPRRRVELLQWLAKYWEKSQPNKATIDVVTQILIS